MSYWLSVSMCKASSESFPLSNSRIYDDKRYCVNASMTETLKRPLVGLARRGRSDQPVWICVSWNFWLKTPWLLIYKKNMSSFLRPIMLWSACQPKYNWNSCPSMCLSTSVSVIELVIKQLILRGAVDPRLDTHTKVDIQMYSNSFAVPLPGVVQQDNQVLK